MKRRDIVSKSELQEDLGLKGWFGGIATGLLMRIVGINRLNREYAKYADYEGPEFSARVLEGFGVKFDLPEEQLSRIPAEGGFITVSNHHFGSIDGLILNQVIGGRRADYRILTTFFLSRIEALKGGFLPVDNFRSGGAKSIQGIKMALKHIEDGGSLGLFPAGEVATYQKGDRRTAVGDKAVVEDKPWADNIVKMIANSGLPVIPIYFDGTNSKWFHRLGKIHPILRTIRLPHELMNKRGTVVKVRIGQPISLDEIALYDIPELGKYLRNRCYALQASCITECKQEPVIYTTPVAEQEDPKLFRDEIAAISDRIVFEIGDFKCYFTKPDDIPHTMRELARLRETIYRLENEGTGFELDTDRFDNTYHHLILWSASNQEIVGAYRVGVGTELMARGGVSEFYTSTLLKYDPSAVEYLSRSMELGRSIVAPQYQKDVLPLKLLLAGLAVVAYKQGVKYCIGPVSISGALPDFYKSLVVHFIRKTASLPSDGAPLAVPTHPFRPDYLCVNPDELLSRYLESVDNVDKLDRLVGVMSDGKYRLPVLVRKYFKSGAKIVDFNVDPDFNNCLDGLILLRLEDFPLDTIQTLVKFMPEDRQKAIIEIFTPKTEQKQ